MISDADTMVWPRVPARWPKGSTSRPFVANDPPRQDALKDDRPNPKQTFGGHTLTRSQLIMWALWLQNVTTPPGLHNKEISEILVKSFDIDDVDGRAVGKAASNCVREGKGLARSQQEKRVDKSMMRDEVAEYIHTNISHELLREYTSDYEVTGVEGLPPKYGDAIAAAMEQEPYDHQKLADAVATLLRARETFSFSESRTTAHIDFGIFCELKGLVCHYIEYSERSGSKSLELRYACITKPLLRREIKPFAQRKVLVSPSDVEHHALANQIVVLSDRSGRGFTLVVVDNHRIYDDRGVAAAIVGVLECTNLQEFRSNDRWELTIDDVTSALNAMKESESCENNGSGHGLEHPTRNTSDKQHTPARETTVGSDRPGATSKFLKRDSSHFSEDGSSKRSRSSYSPSGARHQTVRQASQPTFEEQYAAHYNARRHEMKKRYLTRQEFQAEIRFVKDELENRKAFEVPNHPKRLVMNQAAILDVVHHLSTAARLWVTRTQITQELRRQRRLYNPIRWPWAERDQTRAVFHSLSLMDMESVMGTACKNMVAAQLLEQKDDPAELLSFRLTKSIAEGMATHVVDFSLEKLNLRGPQVCGYFFTFFLASLLNALPQPSDAGNLE
ncbi:hypothetical protein HDV00_012106 [Rhizophlyctis rosea]|nr:hypothetical protein HDV00_012106 [Rhizophlyctis rosea]